MSGARAPIGVGVIGLGFIGRIHLAAYRRAAEDGWPCRVVAVCDCDASRLSDAALPAEARRYAHPEALLADPAVDAVSICTYTDTHVALTRQALEAGRHVLVEKPVALRASAVRGLARLADRAYRARRLVCMPAMCMRYWPEWNWLKQQIETDALGAVRSAAFERLGSRPTWGGGFYDDERRCGGVLVDLHIHDADFIRWCWGLPRRVFAAGSRDHVTVVYDYPAFRATAEAAWDLAPAAGFRMRFLIAFDRGSAEFSLGDRPALRVFRGRDMEAVGVESRSGYDHQARTFLSAIRDGGPSPIDLSDAAETVALLEAARRSMRTFQPVDIMPGQRTGRASRSRR